MRVLYAGLISFVSCIIFFALIAASCAQEDEYHGFRGEGHQEFHEFYRNLYNTNPDVRMSCCNDRDCRPTQARHTNKGWEVQINGVWDVVDDKYIVHKAAPDGGPHICAGEPSSMDPLGRKYCVILPPEG